MSKKQLDRKEILSLLDSIGIKVSYITLIRYAELGLIDQPSYQGRGRGAQALYSPETVAEVYAAYHLLRDDKLSYEVVKEARQIGQYLETTNYSNLQDIMNDIGMRALIFRKPKQVFFVFEWLWLKYTMLPERELAVNSDIRGILLGLAEEDDEYIEALLSGEYKEIENLPSNVRAIIKDRQKRGKAIETALEINRETRRIGREKGEEAAHEYLRKIKAKEQS